MMNDLELRKAVAEAIRISDDICKDPDCSGCLASADTAIAVVRASGRLAPEVEGDVQPHVWVIPGDDSANCNGFVDAMTYQEGEFTLPLYRMEKIAAAMTAALIEARRAALEEAAAWHDEQGASSTKLADETPLFDSRSFHHWERSAVVHFNSASAIRALIPTRPDGAAEGAEK